MTRVLLIDDGMLSRCVTGNALRQAGAHVDYVSNTVGMLGNLKTYKYDVIFLSEDNYVEHYTQILDEIAKHVTRDVTVVLACCLSRRVSRYIRGVDIMCDKPLTAAEAARIFELIRRINGEQEIHSTPSSDNIRHLRTKNATANGRWQDAACAILRLRKIAVDTD